eukprot:Awhi_evm2s2863
MSITPKVDAIWPCSAEAALRKTEILRKQWYAEAIRANQALKYPFAYRLGFVNGSLKVPTPVPAAHQTKRNNDAQ